MRHLGRMPIFARSHVKFGSMRLEGCIGTLVADTSTKRLCTRIAPGEIALISHDDLDEVAADELITAQVAAVINNSSFLTGRYPASGARKLLDANIPIFEVAEIKAQDLCAQRARIQVRITDNQLYVVHGGDFIPLYTITPVTLEQITERWAFAQAQLEDTLSCFIDNTLERAQLEKDLFLKPLPKLPLRTRIKDKHVVLVVRGRHYRQDLHALKAYIEECRPVLLAVDGGADALIDAGYIPDLIVGDMDSVTDRALTCGAELVVHAYPNGVAPGSKRVSELGLPFQLLPAPGMSEDVAMLLAYEEQAKLIVTIGTHNHMIDFLEKGRKGMASTLIVRTKIGSRLVDAKGVSQLYQQNTTVRSPMLIAAFLIMPLLLLGSLHPAAREMAVMLWTQLRAGF